MNYQLLDPHTLRVQGWRYGQIHEMGGTYFFANIADANRQISRLVSSIAIEISQGPMERETSKIIEVGLSHSILKGCVYTSR